MTLHATQIPPPKALDPAHDDALRPTAAAQPRSTLAVLTALSALAFMDRQILAVMLDPVKAEFGLSDLQIGLVTGLGFALTFSVLGVPLGRIADRSERRRLIAWCRGFGGLIGALGGMSVGFWTLMVSRSGCALSDAGGTPASMSMVADLYPPERRSSALSVFGVGGAVGSLMALVAGGWLSQHYGWRATMTLIGGSSIVLAALFHWRVREPLRAGPHGATPTAQHGAPVGAVREILRMPVTRWLLVGAAFALLCGYSFAAWNFSFLVRHHGLTPQAAGLVSGGAAIGSVMGGLIAGRFTDFLVRRDPRWQIGVPMIGLGGALPAGLVYFMLGPGQTVAAAALIFAFAFFISWWVAPIYAALSIIVPARRRATAMAMMLLVGSIVGAGIGPILTGALSDLFRPWFGADALRWALTCVVATLGFGLLAFGAALRAYPAARQAALDQAATRLRG